MFKYEIKEESKRIEEIYTYFNVEFTNDKETYIEEYRVTNDAYEVELYIVETIQITNKLNILNILETQYDSIYDIYGELNLIKNND